MRSPALPVLVLVAVVGGAPAAAAELPFLKPGQWRFTRAIDTGSGTPQQLESMRCEDPRVGMEQQRALLTKQGCRFTPLEGSGQRFTFTAECTFKGLATTSRSEVVVTSETRYSVTVTSTVGKLTSHEVLEATRVGDCDAPKPAKQ